ncbi:MAG TPA: CHASE3 domain-containing protein, partial [Gaiellaceae bacterium]|nr:CHASE3 domain-containing protein [Gaiellaceae bacterium]
MRLGLSARILIGGGIVAVFLVVQLVLVLRAFESIRHDTREEQRAEQSIVAAIQVEKLVLDLETGARGYVITADRRFLAPWTEAKRSLPAESATLMTLAPGTWSKELDRRWRSYVSDWSVPLVNLTARSPALARARIAAGRGSTLVTQIRAMVETFIVQQGEVANAARLRVASAEHNGVTVGATGIALRVLAFALIVGYLLRLVVIPIRRIAGATRQVAGGDLLVEVPEGGAGEVGQLASNFNEMSRSLRRQQRDLAEQNVDLERLANVLRAVLDATVDGIL